MKIRLFSPLTPYLALIFTSVTGITIAADPTSPGTYTNWNGRIDHLTIIQPFKTAAFKKLVVKPVSTENVDLPDESESTYRPVKQTLDRVTDIFVEGVRDTAPRSLNVEEGKTQKTQAGGEALVITARVAKIDPGSWSGRAFGRSKLFHAATDAAETRILGPILVR